MNNAFKINSQSYNNTLPILKFPISRII